MNFMLADFLRQDIMKPQTSHPNISFDREKDPRRLITEGYVDEVLDSRSKSYRTGSEKISKTYRVVNGGEVDYVVGSVFLDEEFESRTMAHLEGDELSSINVVRTESHKDEFGWKNSEVESKQLHWSELSHSGLPKIFKDYTTAAARWAKEDKEELGDYIGNEFGEDYDQERFQISRDAISNIESVLEE